MKFDFLTFQENLVNESESKKENRAICKIIEAVWNQLNVQDINFDSFTYNDILEVLKDFEINVLYDDSDDLITFDSDSYLVQYQLIENTVYRLLQMRGTYPKNNSDFI